MIARPRCPVRLFGYLEDASGYPREPVVLTFPRDYWSAIFRGSHSGAPALAARGSNRLPPFRDQEDRFTDADEFPTLVH